jgi:hypothetical protein
MNSEQLSGKTEDTFKEFSVWEFVYKADRPAFQKGVGRIWCRYVLVGQISRFYM